jgi:hypothetical protein
LPDQTTSEQFVAILVHECAHVVRRDTSTRLLQRLAVLLYWPHPLVHLLNRRLDRAREEVCDNHALLCTDSPTYAETLLRVAQACYPAPRLEGYLSMLTRHYNLESRVADLLEATRDKATRISGVQRLGLVTGFALLRMAACSVGLYGTAEAADGTTTVSTSYEEEMSASEEDASSDKAAVGKVTGRVFLAADGSAASGAIVWAARTGHAPLQRRETVADVRGEYTLNLEPGTWYVWARRGSFGGGGMDEKVEIVTAAAPRRVTIHLEKRGTFRGRLLEAETGKPIVSGKLYLDAATVLTTDAGGRFSMGGLTRTHHEAFVVAPGRMRMRVLFDSTASVDTQLDVPVPHGGKIVGRVTDSDGKPVPGAFVGRATSGSYFSTSGLYLECDKEGRFEYDDAVPPDQPTRLHASATGYTEDERYGMSARDKPLMLNFRLRPMPGTPAGDRVPDAEKRRGVSGVISDPTGKPAAGVVVRWGYQPFVGAIQTATDADGHFRLVVPDKANKLAVLPREFLPQFPSVAAGGDHKVNITLRAGHIARGQVRDDAGKPIQGVRVVAQIPSPDPRLANSFWLTESAVVTTQDGKFEMKGVPAGAAFDFLKTGLSDVRRQSLDLAKADNVVTMRYGGAVSGRVLDRAGTPIRNFRVLVDFPRDRRAGDKIEGFFAGYSGMGVRFTSDDGTFVLTGVGAGSVYRIKAIPEGHGEAVLDRVVAVPINRLKNTRAVTLTTGPLVRFRVTAVTAKGKPIPDARVTLVDGQRALDDSFAWGYDDASWENMVRGRTNLEGFADFPALSFGSATLLVQAPGFGRHRVGWRAGEKEITCKLPPGAVVTGVALDRAGNPVKSCYLRLTNGSDQIPASIGPDDKGRFRVGELPPGAWSLTFLGEDGLSVLHQEDLTLKPAETRELKVKTK